MQQNDERLREEQRAREEAERREAEELAAEENKITDQEESQMVAALEKMNQASEGVLLNAHMLPQSEPTSPEVTFLNGGISASTVLPATSASCPPSQCMVCVFSPSHPIRTPHPSGLIERTCKAVNPRGTPAPNAHSGAVYEPLLTCQNAALLDEEYKVALNLDHNILLFWIIR